MSTVVRRCTKCGHDDLSRRWRSTDEAAEDGALRSSWACANCAWPEAELVEASGTSAGEPSVDPLAQASPEEARRSLDTSGRIFR